MGRRNESWVMSLAETTEHAVSNASLRTSALRGFSFCPECTETHPGSQAFAAVQKLWRRLGAVNCKAGLLLGVIPNPRKEKTTVPNKLAPLNAKENLSHEMEILKQVM